MSASVTEVLGGLGSFSLDHAWDDEIAKVLEEDFCHLRLYWGEHPWYSGVVTSHAPGKDGLAISGRGLDWWLGADADGMLIRDREYIAGTNKLSNGNFAYGSELWRVAEGTLWTVGGTAVFAGGALTVDDELEVDETFAVRPGHVYRTAVTASGGGGLGKLRVRTTYGGRFSPPNLLVNPGFELTGGSRGWSVDTAALSIVADAPNAHSGTRVLRATAIARPQLVASPSFEDGGTGWSAASFISFVNDVAKARTGNWSMRLAAIDKPQLLANPSFELTPTNWSTSTFMSIVTDGANAKTGTKVLRAEEIAKPQLLANPSFEGTANWGTSPGGHLLIVTDGLNAFEGTGVLKVSPITQPQLLTNPGFESGTTGWTFPASSEFAVPLTTPENVFAGSSSLKAGPVDRVNVIPNANFDSGTGETFANWVHSPPPTVGSQPGDWYHDTGTFFNGPASATTTGGGDPYADPGLAHKWMRAHPSSGENDGFTVAPLDRYRFEAKTRAAVDDLGRMDGTAHISVVFRPTQGGPTSTWVTSQKLAAGGGEPGWEWNDLIVEFEVPEDMTVMQPHLVVDGHHFGYWHFDQVRLFKLRDNVSQANSDAVTVEPEQSYEVSAMVKSDVNVSQGDVQLRVELTGSGLPTKHHTTTTQGSTKRRGFSARDWVKIAGTFQVEAGYTSAKVFVVARDVLGGSFRVDNVFLHKTTNNSDEIIANPVGITPKQRYEVAAYVRSGTNLKGGTVHIRTRFYGAGKPDLEFVTTRRGATKNKWERIATTATPPKGYQFAAVSVVATDVLGDFFWVDRAELIKDNNNSGSVSATAVSVVPEQSYRISAQVRPSEKTTEGSIFLRVRLAGTDGKDTYVESSRVGLNEDLEWVETSVTVRPGRKQPLLVVSVVAIDVEGDPLWVDDVLVEKVDNNSTTTTFGTPFAVVAGSRYRLVAHVRSDDTISRGQVTVEAKLTGAGLDDSVVSRTERFTEGAWDEVAVDISVPTGYTAATLRVTGTDIEGETGQYFWLDDLTLTRMTGNSETVTGVAFAVVPERRYRWSMWARSDSTEVIEGNVRLGLRYTQIGRPDVVVQSSPADGEGSEWKRVDFDFTPPSGYATATPSITATDVAGGYFWVDDGDIRDTDTATHVEDLVVASAGSPFLDTTAPAGAEKARVSLVAEAGAPAYTVTNLSLSRVGTPATVAAIVDALLRDPVSNAYVSLTPGTIYGSDTIVSDWHLRNTVARRALLLLCQSGIALPVREYRVNPDFTLDLGTAAQLYQERDEILLVDGEAVLISNPSVDQSAEGLITNVTVIGGDRETLSGTRRIVEGHATAGTVAFDRFNNPVRRERVVSEPSITSRAVADSYAAFLLAEANRVREHLTVEISDWRALGGPEPFTAPSSPPSFRVGDWVPIYKPEAGLEDRTNERTLRGKVVYPVHKRVVSRRTRLGEGKFRAELIPPTGDPIPLKGVQWDSATTASLELGDPRPEFATNAEGGSLSAQFTRWRASLG